MGGHRAFISYSHENRALFSAVHGALVRRGLQPWSDGDLTPHLVGFTEQIKSYIAHSHVFVPLLTPESHARGWVHQEIGFAVAMKVPVVPVCVGRLPDGMIQMAQAVVIDGPAEGALLDRQLERVDFAAMVDESGIDWQPPSEGAPEPENRATLLERYASDARKFVGPQTVRQAGGYSSFSIPDEKPGHAKWRARSGNRPLGAHTAGLLRRERRAIEAHASAAGCRLIVNLGIDSDAFAGPGCKHARLSLLLEFLLRHAQAPGRVQMVLVEQYPPHSVLAVGDWFIAESRSATFGRGYEQTLFTAHAPFVSRCVREFDEEFDDLLSQQRVRADEACAVAIERLGAEVARLPAHADWPPAPG